MFHNQNRVGQTLQKKEILRRVGAEVGGFGLLRWDAYLRNSCPDQSVSMRGKTRTCTGHPMTFLRWTN
nr:hypothetical protein CFP56_53119 [Quercus suber]